MKKINHRRTPYIETFNCSYSPTVKKCGAVTLSENVAYSPPAKVIDFKPAAPNQTAASAAAAPVEEKSGEQSAQETVERGKRTRGAINLNQLDALEL